MAPSTRRAARLIPALFSLAWLASVADCGAQTSAQDNGIDGQVPKTRSLPIRADRRWSVLGEVGFDSRGSLGGRLGYHVLPQITVEGTAGITGEGVEAGARTRYNLSLSNLTAYVGLGAAHVFGAAHRSVSPVGSDASVDLRIEPTNYVQALSGVDWVAGNGVDLVTTVGYAWRLGPDNVEVQNEAELTPSQREVVSSYVDNIIVSLALGYSF